MELWHVPFNEHWAVLDKNARHVVTLLLLIRDRRFCRTLHFLHIFLVFRLHTLQRPCGPVPRIWFTPSKRMSGNCDIEADAALGVAARSDCSKLRTTCRRNSRWLSGLSSMKQCIRQAATIATFTALIYKGQYHFLLLIVGRYAAASLSRR
ncbi:hypothetical protein T05_11285 [Trichinella murrelli]|uniref:Uncharacterized protein n=1 Tax=Trichinella murrelli TaxID=144512 RepID=A0A0V0UEZ3_9BILA|nr:hypothetical protein T05_11285 [Trichinella murrelli]